jgi:hypothetical protein
LFAVDDVLVVVPVVLVVIGEKKVIDVMHRVDETTCSLAHFYVSNDSMKAL